MLRNLNIFAYLYPIIECMYHAFRFVSYFCYYQSERIMLGMDLNKESSVCIEFEVC